MKLSFSLLVLAWRLRSLLPDGSRLKKLCVGGWDHCNAEGFAGETGAVDQWFSNWGPLDGTRGAAKKF